MTTAAANPGFLKSLILTIPAKNLNPLLKSDNITQHNAKISAL
jgi:hypothetical protein